MTDDHRAEALDSLAALTLIRTQDAPADKTALASEATAHALLAVEERLSEIAERLHTANVLGAFQSGAIRSDADYAKARETVRNLLDLPKENEA